MFNCGTRHVFGGIGGFCMPVSADELIWAVFGRRFLVGKIVWRILVGGFIWAVFGGGFVEGSPPNRIP